MAAYLDNAATTKPCDEAVSACLTALTENYGNPSSLHKIGLNAENAVSEARKAIAAALVCQPVSFVRHNYFAHYKKDKQQNLEN